MGTWGPRTFADDIAVDWLEDLHDSDPIAFFRQCFDLSGHDYLDHIACVGVVCSSEMVHALLREPRPGLPESAHQWLLAHEELNVQPFVAEAIVDLGRVIGPQSEMHELWEDNQQGYDDWRKQILDLISRLEAVLAESHSP